jgi:hypothetical protein
MDQRQMMRVLGRSLPYSVPATLRGFKKLDTTLGFPIILPDSGSYCQGVVYFSLSHTDWERLDRYENVHNTPPVYIRRLASVDGKHGRISAQIYVGNLAFFRTRIKR